MGKRSHSLENNYETKTGDYETRVSNYDKNEGL